MLIYCFAFDFPTSNLEVQYVKTFCSAHKCSIIVATEKIKAIKQQKTPDTDNQQSPRARGYLSDTFLEKGDDATKAVKASVQDVLWAWRRAGQKRELSGEEEEERKTAVIKAER